MSDDELIEAMVAARGVAHVEVVERAVAPAIGTSFSTRVLLPVCRAPVSTTAGITRRRAASASSTRRGRVFTAWMIFIHAADWKAWRAASWWMPLTAGALRAAREALWAEVALWKERAYQQRARAQEAMMTKKVRIENADTAAYKVIVEVWDKSCTEGEPDVLVKTIELPYPTAMTGDDVYLTSSRYLVVKEAA